MNALHRFISEMHIAIIKSRSNRGLIKKMQSFLVNGFYKNTATFDRIIKKSTHTQIDSSTFSSLESTSINTRRFVDLYNSLFLLRVNSPIEQKNFLGTELIITSSKTEFKFFDYNKKQVLTTYKSLQKLRMIEKNKNEFIKSFNIPITLHVNEEKSYLVEELITHVKYDVDKALSFICDCIISLYSKQGFKVRFDGDTYKRHCAYFAKRFGDSRLLNNEAGSLKCLTHGDLWSSNVLFDGSNYFITDFERVEERFFLFDFFLFIFVEWQLKGNILLLDNYFSGRYDSTLCRIFSILNQKYDSYKKDEYLLAFLVEITYERWRTFSGIDEKIHQIMDLYIPLYKNDV